MDANGILVEIEDDPNAFEIPVLPEETPEQIAAFNAKRAARK